MSDLALLEHICLSNVFYALCHLLVHTYKCSIPISSSFKITGKKHKYLSSLASNATQGLLRLKGGE